MAYFNNAFKKTLVLSDYIAPAAATTTVALTSGEVSLFNSRTWAPSTPATDECEFLIVAGAPYQNDRVGPFHGGYQESIKSKGINPKYVSKIWQSDSHAASPFVLNIGTTLTTIGDADCCPIYLCGEQYHLRVDIKGDPVLRMLNHQGYIEVTADGGCCDPAVIAPVEVDPATIMIQWAEGIWRSAVMTGNGPNFNGATTGNAATRFNPNPFIVPVVQFAIGGAAIDTLLYPPGYFASSGLTPAIIAAATGVAVGRIMEWDNYVSTWTIGNSDCAGLTLTTAYMDTQFGDCTFQPSDYYNVEPIRIFASEVDLNGDPCEFEGLCVEIECPGLQAEGLGETALRDFILSESYRQNPFATDLRIREITQGNDMLGTGPGQVDRTALYDRTMIMHTVPRFNNPSGVFDNDQYIVEVLSLGTVAGRAERTAFLTDIRAILTNVDNETCVEEADQAPGVGCAAPSVPVTV